MWTFKQSTGELFRDDVYDAIGYAGHAEGRDNPALQTVANVGPLPQGHYTIEPPRDTATHGPFVLSLTPDQGNAMYGRGGFLIHGDATADPGNASHGCMIFARVVRERIWASGDHLLQVIA